MKHGQNLAGDSNTGRIFISHGFPLHARKEFSGVSGVSRSVAMELVGHMTESVYQ
jgi:hypothetical protein